MAYQFVNASSQYISGTLASSFSAPLTLFAVAKFDSTTPTNRIAICIQGTQAARHQLGLNSASSAFSIASFVAGNTGANATGGTMATSQFRLGAALSSQASRILYIDGVAISTNTDSVLTGDCGTVLLGTRYDGSSYGVYMDGKLSECAIWNAALDADEMASLGKGFKPTRIRPQSLVFYAPLIRNLIDRKGGIALTNNNTATVADHPRVI